jgi:Domain of unknown function (DUF3291)
MNDWHLAQVNIGILRASLDTPEMAEFKNGLEVINALAESSEGFIWRLVDEDGADATTLRPFGDDRLINMSLWRSIEALRGFVYKSNHRNFLAKRMQWFAPMQTSFMALWWVPAGHIPTLDEAKLKLELLEAHGPTQDAFTFAKSFTPTV